MDVSRHHRNDLSREHFGAVDLVVLLEGSEQLGSRGVDHPCGGYTGHVSGSRENTRDARLGKVDRTLLFRHRGVCRVGIGDGHFLDAQAAKRRRSMKYFWL